MRPSPLCTLAVWALVAGPSPSSAGLHFGLKGGVPLTEYFETGRRARPPAEYSAATRRYTVGIAAEWRSLGGAGLEADVLYKRMGYVGVVSTPIPGINATSSLDAKGHSWDAPVMAKYRFRGTLRPYLAAGGVLRYVGPVRARGEITTEDVATGTTVRAPIDTSEPSDLRKRFYPGLVAAGGLELGSGRLHVLPEVRYTHWTANIAGAGGLLRFAPRQAEFLLGVLF